MTRKNSRTCGFIAVYLVFSLVFAASSLSLYALAVGMTSNTSCATDKATASSTDASSSIGCLMIDAGHGGEDGGAVGVNGAAEKEINLAVAEDIAALSLLFGVPYSMTRVDDSLLYDKYDNLESYDGRKKSLDLKNRLRCAEEENALLFLSIHMNKFTSPAYSGLQVYYSPNTEDGRVLAEAIQTFTRAHLQRDNERQPKAATSSIYLLHRLKMPAVLVECGFLSNPTECALLSDDAYRASLSCTVFVPVLEYFVRQS